MLQLRVETCIAVLILSFCVLAIADPIRTANFIYRRGIAEPGDLFFTLAYRLIAIVGAVFSLYILVVDLWSLTHP